MPVQKMLVVDVNKCTGCRMCEMACSLFHEGVCSPSLSRIRVYERHAGVEEITIPVVCMHCTDPPCVAVCPMGGMKEDKDTGTGVCADVCIGCRLCFMACPVGAISFAPPPNVKPLKCDLCGGDPQCVKFCQTQALVYVPVMQAHRLRAKKLLDHYVSRRGETPEDEGAAAYEVKV